ncbi:MAG: transcription-repair coupling factor, partial [Eudoraea sp.]|nr:transcription-repair coupling factor [Eudoraea sp.]
LYEDSIPEGIYVKEAQLDSDFELLFPDTYVNNISERLSLYTQLNEIRDESSLEQFEKQLVDSFGPLPKPAIDLLNSVRIKWTAQELGLEKIVMKKGKLLGYFVSDQQSAYYQSPVFTQVLQYAQTHPDAIRIKEKETRSGLRLMLTIEGIDNIDAALTGLKAFLQEIPAT